MTPWSRESGIVVALARALIAGDQSLPAALHRCQTALGPRKWLSPLAARYLDHFRDRIRPREHEVAQFLARDPGLLKALAGITARRPVRSWLTEPQRMQPARAAQAWNVPVIETSGDMAAWFAIDPLDLDWFADLKGFERHPTAGRARHYHYRLLPKRSGGARLLECPKPALKWMQRRVLRNILAAIPPHPAAHGFVRHRSIVTFAEPHTGQDSVLRMDLEDFFPSISGPRVQALFRLAGYPEPVADRLGGLCTNVTPADLLRDVANPERFTRPHLPQGAPTSPVLANLCAWRLDTRLSGLAAAFGATYTRYADDLAFSGDTGFTRTASRLATWAAVIAAEEGFTVNHRKTRLMCQGTRQHLAGLTTNVHPNISRDDYDRLKAILTNCVRSGPESQNRDGHPAFRQHLDGRVAFVSMVNPARGHQLRSIFNRIRWPE